MSFFYVALYGLLLSLLIGLVKSSPHDSHYHTSPRILSEIDTWKRWYHPRDHPAHALFKRDNDTDGYPTVGSTEWTNNYPEPPLNTTSIPEAWITAYQAAMSSGLIPNISIPTMGADGNPVYPDNQSPTSESICSFTYQCTVASDIVNAPDGMIGIAFDDGPLPTSPPLYDFLSQQNQKATHFFIGVNIWYYPQVFLQAYGNADDICVHTYTHPYMTTLSNEEIVAELGWTMQIIHDSTDGRLPRFWRPPYGDADMRVRAIASQVFGLTTVVWNQDSSDWQLSDPNPEVTPATVNKSLVGWIDGPKSPGLIILEHELSTYSVQAFIDVYPLMKSQGWDTRPIPELFGLSWYLNSENTTSPVVMSLEVAQSGLAQLPSTIAAPSSASNTGTVFYSLIAGSPTSTPTSSKNSASTSAQAPILLSFGLIALTLLFMIR